jgi:hypothetical protein
LEIILESIDRRVVNSIINSPQNKIDGAPIRCVGVRQIVDETTPSYADFLGATADQALKLVGRNARWLPLNG